MTYRGPKYLRIKQDMIEKISQNHFPPDEMLPSENKLIEQYNVSRITVRKAMDELAMEGYIYRIQGKGTYAKNSVKSINLSLTKYPYSCSEEIKRQNMTPKRVVLEQKIIPCSFDISKRLEISEGSPVLFYKRTYMADNIPACLTYGYINSNYLPDIENINLKETKLSEVYANHYHLDVFRGSRIIDSIPATKEQAHYLNIIEEYPLLHIRNIIRHYINGQIIPLDTSDAYYNTSIFKLTIEGIDEFN